MKDKTAQQKGKDFEGKIQDFLKSMERKRRVTTLRLYDTRSAGNYLPAQPGDFVTVAYGKPYLIEAKSSGKHATLADRRAPLTSLFDAAQIAKMRLWHRAGATVWVIFQCQVSKSIELWKGEYIAECYVEPRRLADFSECWHYPDGDIGEACRFMLRMTP